MDTLSTYAPPATRLRPDRTALAGDAPLPAPACQRQNSTHPHPTGPEPGAGSRTGWCSGPAASMCRARPSASISRDRGERWARIRPRKDKPPLRHPGEASIHRSAGSQSRLANGGSSGTWVRRMDRARRRARRANAARSRGGSLDLLEVNSAITADGSTQRGHGASITGSAADRLRCGQPDLPQIASAAANRSRRQRALRATGSALRSGDLAGIALPGCLACGTDETADS
jgi:hypothetical protein